MILVLLGTNDKKFDRLLSAIDNQIKKGNIKEKVIVQAGSTKYKSNKMEIFDLIPKNKLEELIKKADVIITHGGVGSIIESLEKNKIVIAAARLKKYDEHTNNHQEQIVKEFAKRGYILELEDFNELDKILKSAKKFKPAKYKSNNENFVNTINDYIEKTDNKSIYNRYRELIKYGFPNLILIILNIVIFLNLNFSLESNIVVTHFITFLISLLLYRMIDININKTNIFMKMINFILDFVIMILLIDNLDFEINSSKTISILLASEISYFIIKKRYIK